MKNMLLSLTLVTAILAPALSEARQAFDPAPILELIDRGDHVQAEQALNRATSAQKAGAAWHFTRGRLALARKHYSDATRDFERAASLEPDKVDYIIAIGRASCSDAQQANVIRRPLLARKCRRSFETALDLDSLNIEAINSLITFHLTAPGLVGGSMSEAEQLTQKLMDIHPFHGYTARMRLAINQADTIAALAALHEGSQALPDSVYFPVTRGLMLGDVRRYAEAHEELSRARSMRPDHPLIHLYYGRLASISGENLDSGLESLELILKNYSDKFDDISHSMIYVKIGRIYLKKEDKDAARTAFGNALKIRYDNERAAEELRKL